ncbi:sensor histidine kinase [Reinekea blandensis]|uniref:Alginate biosynthesis protein AlgZ/FimS n=1 Tax=Reinekea blandensis MED297 TaxID=314283 RepID=A4BAR1_9GAMM|nr:histidine kinase [Reinekea blandensis]EAR11017.1 alginate biosynthesis protein AlgZ/FimS [Reinekea sp. MED297] [Reinekea blandensis MED297]
MSTKNAFVIPNLCQTVPLLLLILVSELCVLVWTLTELPFSWAQLGLRSITVQWIVLLSAAALCQLRPLLSRFSLRTGWLLCFVVILVTGLTVIGLGYWLVRPQAFSVGHFFRLGLAVSILAAMVLRYFQILQQVIENNQAEVSSRLDALQARIKPHFLFNSLNTISELIATRPQAAEDAVENLSTLFRANLRQTSSFCALQQEIDLVKGYLELEQWRLGERLSVDWQESLDDPSAAVPVLCLQPLVENAIVHGIAPQPSGGCIRVSVLQSPRVTTLMVENPIDPTRPGHTGHGVGLDNVRHRLSVLYGDAARCQVEQSDRLYKVTVVLPRSSVQEGT